LFRGRKAGPNPWCATGLEWSTPSHPTKQQIRAHSGRDSIALLLRAGIRQLRHPGEHPPCRIASLVVALRAGDFDFSKETHISRRSNRSGGCIAGT
jgi:hypothetical protein